VTIPIIIIITSIIIYIINNRKENIIRDTGCIKCILLLIGFLLYFIGLNFNSFSSYSQSALYFLFKHCGQILIYMISLIYILTGCELGTDKDEMDKIDIMEKYEITTIEDCSEKNKPKKHLSLNIDLLKKIEKQLNPGNDITQNSSKLTLINSDSMNKMDMLELNKSVNYVHSLCVEFTGIYIMIFCVFITFIIYYGKEKTEYIQQYDGKWRYKSPLESINMIANLSQLILIIYLVIKVIKVWNFIYIFSCLKYIGYSSIIWITMGSLVNVLKYI